jgi:Holliday junction resolvase
MDADLKLLGDPVKTYAKGSRNERELLYILHSRGFSCMRAASSGGFFSPVDVVAIKKGLVLGLECKAWSRMPRLEKRKARAFIDWCERAGALGFLAWRTTGRWLFLDAKNLGSGDYSEGNWLGMEDFFGIVDIR